MSENGKIGARRFSAWAARIFVAGLVVACIGVILLLIGLLAANSGGWYTRPAYIAGCYLFGLPLASVGIALCILTFSGARASWMMVLGLVGLVVASVGVVLLVVSPFVENRYASDCIVFGLPPSGVGVAVCLIVFSNRKARWVFLAGLVMASAGLLLAAFGTMSFVWAGFLDQPGPSPACLTLAPLLLAGGAALCWSLARK
jgi:hypothetical protein